MTPELISQYRKRYAITVGFWAADDVHDDIMKFLSALESAQAELKRLRDLAAICYAGLGAECNLPEPWLDALSAAANGEPFSAEGLLPFVVSKPDQEIA